MYRDNLVLISQHIDPILHHKDMQNKKANHANICRNGSGVAW